MALDLQPRHADGCVRGSARKPPLLLTTVKLPCGAHLLCNLSGSKWLRKEIELMLFKKLN
jgi:hypothetical protein